MKKQQKTFHWADIRRSPRLRRLRDLLRRKMEKDKWMTTWEVTIGARVVAASTAIAELRKNGFRVTQKFDHRDTHTGSNVHKYRMTGWKKHAFLA